MNEEQGWLTRERVESLFANVHDLREFWSALAIATNSARPSRLMSHETPAEDRARIRRLKAEFGASGQSLVDAFHRTHRDLASRAEMVNIGSHPSVAIAMARVMQQRP
jgi:hypothetical protein